MNYVKKTNEKIKKNKLRIEELREEISELEDNLIGIEITHEGKEAIVMEMDWDAEEVYLNYDDENFEWVYIDDLI